MPAKSKKQQMAAGAALSAKRGEIPKSKLKGASKEMAGSMSEKQLREMASTPRKSLPRKKSSTKAGTRSGSGGGASGQKRAAGKRSTSRTSTRKR